MAESQKDIIERLLKERKRTKRELAVYLNISENSISRMLKNKNIALGKLEKIADFLEVNTIDLFPVKNSLEDPKTAYLLASKAMVVNENIVEKLSEALLSGNRTNEIMAETQKSQLQTIENLVQIIKNKLS